MCVSKCGHNMLKDILYVRVSQVAFESMILSRLDRLTLLLSNFLFNFSHFIQCLLHLTGVK